MRLLATLAAATVALAGTSLAARANVHSTCELREAEETRSVGCDFRLSSPVDVRQATIVANGQELPDARFTPFEAGDGRAAWFFLIDRSNPARASNVKRSVDLAKEFYRGADRRNIMAIGTFAEDLRVLVSPGDLYADVDSRLQGVKADGAATAFFFTAIKAIDILRTTEAERKGLVIISDGKAEDTAYRRDDVIKAAREAGVVIYGIGLAEKRSDTIALQEVERLASETGGPFVSAVGAAPLPPAFIADFGRHLKSGGLVEAPLGDLDGEIAVKPRIVLSDGTVAEGAAASIYVAPDETAAPDEPLPLIGRIYSIFEPASPGSSRWAAGNAGLAWALLFLPLLGVAAFAGPALRRRRGIDQDLLVAPTGFTETVAPEQAEVVTHAISLSDDTPSRLVGGEIYGYFEVIGGDHRRFEIREQNVTIGRHSESDFRLNDDTVHRHHAVFHISPDGHPVIADLDTVNGVVVNGERISKVELKPGDIIELGEVRLRFLAP